MKTIKLNYDGGPLDGATREERVPSHWDAIRYEHLRDGRIHVYFGEISGDSARLAYAKCETAEVSE